MRAALDKQLRGATRPHDSPSKTPHKEFPMKEKDTLVSQTDNQRNPGAAKPEDFQIVRDGDGEFGGQRSDEILKASDRECGRKAFAGTPDRNNVDKAGPPHSDGFGRK
jgi:hypothetical protein